MAALKVFILAVFLCIVTAEFKSQFRGQRDLDKLKEILQRTLKEKDEREMMPFEKKSEKQEDGEYFYFPL